VKIILRLPDFHQKILQKYSNIKVHVVMFIQIILCSGIGDMIQSKSKYEYLLIAYSYYRKNHVFKHENVRSEFISAVNMTRLSSGM
jgi:hypothetical protein